LNLLAESYSEDKLAGVLLLREHILAELGVDDLPAFAAAFGWRKNERAGSLSLRQVARGERSTKRGRDQAWHAGERSSPPSA